MPAGEINGVLPVDKPAGPTSHDIVAVARRALGTRRIGHTGTLDPFASGLLLLCVGAATRIAEYLSGLSKSYTATMRLGIVTTTDDVEGEVLTVAEEWRSVTRERLNAALHAQEGEQLQTPPRYSAKKIRGERAYAIARKGGEVHPEPVPVAIYRAELTRFAPPDVTFEVDCSTGTYIRAIARDIGENVGVGAHLTALRRTRIGPFSITEALRVESLEDATVVDAALLTPVRALAHLPRETLSAAEVKTISHGGFVHRASLEVGGPVVLVDSDGDLVAVGRFEGDRLRPSKVFR